MPIGIAGGVFFFLLLLRVPVAFVLLGAAMSGLLAMGMPLGIVMRRLFTGIDTFVYLAIPLFILTGNIMAEAGIMKRIVGFTDLLIGRFRGGLAHSNVMASMIFGGISGVAVADVSALGSILIPAMEEDGYDLPFSAAITATSSLQGPIIPPSVLAVVYAAIMGESVGALFALGLPMGILIGITDMIIVHILAKRRNYPKKDIKVTFREALVVFKDAFLALLTPVILIGGIIFGVFSPTEAAGVGAFYAGLVALTVFKLPLGKLPKVLVDTAVTTAAVMLLVAAATVFSWFLTVSGTATIIVNGISAITTNPIAVLLLANVFLLLLGMFVDAGPSLIIAAPLLYPLLVGELGLHPLHFAMIVMFNVCLGTVTPPVGVALFAAASIAKIPLERVARAAVPMLMLDIGALMFITFVPQALMWIPRVLGFIK